MLAPTDAAFLALLILAGSLAFLLRLAAARQTPRTRRLHAVRFTDGQGLRRALAVYATSESDALRRARRIAPAHQDLTVTGARS
jgi:KaiC/GvpD/RAD55 family RecA-like ATPase